MKVTRELLEKGAKGFNFTKEQMEIIGMKSGKHQVKRYLESNPVISEETYQKFLNAKRNTEVSRRKEEARMLLNDEVKKYDSEHDREKRKVVNWPFTPFTKYTTYLYGVNKSVKSLRWALNVERQLIIAYFEFTSFTLCCTYKWQDKSVRIERIAESKTLIDTVDVEKYREAVKAYFPKLKVVIKKR